LLGNGAAPFDLASSTQIRPSRPGHADVVEAGMLEEPDILNGHDCTSQAFGNVTDRGQDATLDEKLTNELLIARIDLGHQAWLICPQLIQRRKIFREVPEQPTGYQPP
jgi:hypothetical protein